MLSWLSEWWDLPPGRAHAVPRRVDAANRHTGESNLRVESQLVRSLAHLISPIAARRTMCHRLVPRTPTWRCSKPRPRGGATISSSGVSGTCTPASGRSEAKRRGKRQLACGLHPLGARHDLRSPAAEPLIATPPSFGQFWHPTPVSRARGLSKQLFDADVR